MIATKRYLGKIMNATLCGYAIFSTYNSGTGSILRVLYNNRESWRYKLLIKYHQVMFRKH